MTLNPASGANQGVSINFDAQALHDAEEAEFQQEEQQRQQELRNILTAAFDDDLSDEEEEEDGTGDSQSNTSHEDRHPTPNPEERAGWNTASGIPKHMYGLAQTSTPAHPRAPPLATPAPTPYMTHQQPTGPVGEPIPYPDPQYQYPTHDTDVPNHDVHPQEWESHAPPSNDAGFIPHPHYQRLGFGKREETEGGNELQGYYDAVQHRNFYMHQAYSDQGHGPPPHSGPSSHPPQDVGVYSTGHQPPYPQDNGVYFTNTDYGSHQPNPPGHRTVQSRDLVGLDIPDHRVPFTDYGAEMAASPHGETAGELDGYRVKYQASEGVKVPQLGKPDKEDQPASATDSLRSTTPHDELGNEVEDMQRDFLNQGGAADSRQLGQLQILYNARGRKIEELTSELKTLRNDTDREIRILKHKVALTQDERDGLEGSLKQSQALMTDVRHREAELEGKMAAMETQITGLHQGKDQLVKKLQAAESTIESLNIQLCELEKSESLARTRDHHDAIVSGLQHKYDTQILDLKEKLDASNQNNETQEEDISSLKKHVSELLKSAENAQIDRADTINRLSQSLEDSQRQCQMMLEAGTGQELSKVKLQLQDTIAGKTIAQDMVSALQGELQEIKEQVMMYESASQYGVFPQGGSTSSTPRLGVTSTAPTSADDSYTQLGIRKDTKTDSPTTLLSRPSGDSLTTEQTLHGLKNELERCLVMYRTKRQHVSSLQEELRASRSCLDSMQVKLDAADRKVQETAAKLVKYEAEFGALDGSRNNESVHERRLQRQVDSLNRDKESLNEEVKELSSRIEEIALSEEKLKDLNQELRHQMIEMVKEFDEDKRQALEHCQTTLMEHHETVKSNFKAELQEHFSQEKQTLTQQYEEGILTLRQQIEAAQTELYDVKNMYVTVCQSKEELQQDAGRLWHDKMETAINKVKEKMAEEKDEEMRTLKITWAANNDTALAAARKKWLKEQEEEITRKVQSQVAMAKVTWLREHAAAKETSVKVALANAEREWKLRWETELEVRLHERLEEVKEKWDKSKKNECINDANTNTSMAQAGCEQASTLDIEVEVARRVSEARQLWETTGLAKALAEERATLESTLQSRLETAKETWRQTELKTALAEVAAIKAREDGDVLKARVADMLTEAKTLWFEEQRREVEATVASIKESARQDAQSQIEEATLQLQQELAELRASKQHVEDQLSLVRTQAAEERSELLSVKDSERRQAVSMAQDQCERDYREFLSEHQNTLNKALRTAREEFSKEKVEMESKHADELKGLRERESKAAELEVAFNKERAKLEQRWQEKLDHVTQEHAQEKDTLMRNHRDNLLRALEEARCRWQQKYEEALAESGSSVLEEREAAWSTERNTLKAEMAHFRNTAKSVTDQHQQALDRIKGDLDQAHSQELTMLREQLSATHRAELASATADMQSQLDIRASEMDRLSEEVRVCVSGLEEAQRVAAQEARELRSAISERDADIARLKAELTASTERFAACEYQNKDVVKKLEGKHKEAHEVEQQVQDMLEAFRAKEGEHAQITACFKDRQRELIERLQNAERKLKSAEATTQKQVAHAQESLECEHSVAMEKMKAKMVELRSNNIVALDTLRKQYTTEKREWKREIEQQGRARAHTLTQTDRKSFDNEALSDLGSYYLKAVHKLRGEVLRHVKESNVHAAATVRDQVVGDRHNTARRLRRYYMKCLNHLLDAENHLTRQEKLAFFEQAIEAVPSRDISQLTLQSNSTGESRPSTPDFPITTTASAVTSATNTPKGSTPRSRVDVPSQGKTKDAQSNVRESNPKVSYKSHDKNRSHRQNKNSHVYSNYDKFHCVDSLDNQRHVDVPSLDLTRPSSSGSNYKTSSGNNTPGSHRQKSFLRDNSWESQNSGENQYQSGFQDTPNVASCTLQSGFNYTPNAEQLSAVSRDSESQSLYRSETRTMSSNRSRYNLSSKSAEYFSIEEPRGGKSTRFSTEPHELEVEMPSVSKSQSVSCLSQSTEPRKYYDIDLDMLMASSKRAAQFSDSHRSTPLTKVNSETYLLTPGLQPGLHGSISMGDVRDLEDDIGLAESKYMCQSDDGLLNCDSEVSKGGRAFKSPKNTSVPSSGPLKCMSMPDVAQSGDLNWRVNRKLTPRTETSNKSVLKKYEDMDWANTSDTADPSPYVSTRSKRSKVALGDGWLGNGSHGKREQHRVVFKNPDHDQDDSISDNESVKSFATTSSVSSFRQALKIKQSRLTIAPQAVGSGVGVATGSTKKPLRAPPPSSQLQNMLAQVPDNVHRPVAMVTRHTQMPSPRPVYKSKSSYNQKSVFKDT